MGPRRWAFFSSLLEDEAAVPEAAVRIQPVQDAVQGCVLVRCQVDEGKAALVAEKPFSCGGVLSAHDGTSDHPDRKGERTKGGRQFQRAGESRTKEVVVLDAGTRGAEIQQVGVQCDPHPPARTSGNSYP
jgi:hypothetical protein